MKTYNFRTEDKFLWLPKKIYDKWHWLEKVKVVYKTCQQSVGGEVVEYVVSKWYEDGSDVDE